MKKFTPLILLCLLFLPLEIALSQDPLTIDTNYDGYVWVVNSNYGKNTVAPCWYVGGYFWGFPPQTYKYRGFLRFPVNIVLPSDANVSQVRFYCYCYQMGESNHLTDIHAYAIDGTQNPEDHTGVTLWNNCASGNLYIDDSDAFQNWGQIWFDLGIQACNDIMNALSVNTTFSIALHEEGDNDGRAEIWSSEKAQGGYPQYMPILEITYTAPSEINVPVLFVGFIVVMSLVSFVFFIGFRKKLNL